MFVFVLFFNEKICLNPTCNDHSS